MVWDGCEVCGKKIEEGDDVIVLNTGRAHFGFWARLFGYGRVRVKGDAATGAIHRNCASFEAERAEDVGQDVALLLVHLATGAGS